MGFQPDGIMALHAFRALLSRVLKRIRKFNDYEADDLHLNLTWASSLAAVYTAVCLFVGSGPDFGLQDENILFYRILPIYGIATLVSLITSFERNRRCLAACPIQPQLY